MSNDFYWDDEQPSKPTKTVAAPQQETMGAEEFIWDDEAPAQQEAAQRPPQSPLSSIGDWAGGVAKGVGQDLESAWAGVQHGGMELDKMGYGLYQTGKEALGLNDAVSREVARERVANMSNYQKAREAKMGGIGQVTSMATQMAPHIMASPVIGPVGAMTMGAATTTGDIAQKQITKYGEVDPSTALEYGAGSGMVDYALNRYSMGLAGKVAAPLKKAAIGVGESAASGAQQSIATDLGAGDEITAEKTAASALMGGAIRGGFEGIKYSPLNKNGLKGAEEANSVTTKLGTTNNVEGFAQSAGVGKNTLAGYNADIMNAPTMARSFEEFENMTKYTKSPEVQDAVVSDVMTDMFDNMKGLLTRKNFDYETADGRQVRDILGLDERAMVKSSDIMHNVDRPLARGEDPVIKAETTNAWLDQYNKAGMKLVTDRAGAYDTMIAKIDEQINIDTNMKQDPNVDTTQLNGLKTHLSKIKEAITNYSEGGDVRNLTEAIDIHGAQAMRYASQTGMVGKLNGVRGKGEPFNPAYDLQYMKSLNDSLTAADPNFFKRSGGDATKELGLDLRRPSVSVPTLLKEVGNQFGMGRMRKEKATADELFSAVSTALSKQPTRPITPEPSPAAKVDTALKAGDFDGAAKASDDALSASGMNTIKPVTDLATANSKIDDIVSPTKETPVEAPVRPVEEVIPEVAPKAQPDLDMARKPVQKVEEPVITPEPEVAPIPKVEEPKKVPDMARAPKAKEVAPKAEPEVKAEPVKREGVPVKKPELKTVLDKIKNESTRLTNLPLKAKGREEAKMASNLKKASEYLEDQAKRLTAKGKYSDNDVAEMIDSGVMAAGGLDKIGHISDFKRAFNIDKMETDYAKKLTETAERAQARAEKITTRIATTEKNRAARKAEREAEVTENKQKREADKARVAKESHDTVKQYAKDEGLEDADLSQVMKKLGVTSSDPVNPVRARAELERIKTARETKIAKDQAAELKASKTEAEIKRQKADVAIKLDKLSKELDEVKTALKGATGDSRASLIRRREELDSRVREMDRVREDINGIESTEAIQKRIDSTESKIKQSERNVEDLERQLKQIEDAMSENGASKAEITEYLSNKFDIRRLPIESIDNARNQAVKHAKSLRESDKAAETADIKQAEKELVAEVKGADSEAEVQGIMDAVTKNISDMLKDPKFIAEHQAALDMMKAVGKAAKANPAVDKHKANAWEMYFDILAEGARRKSQGVKDKHLVDNIALKELREEYQKMRGISEGASTTAGRFWTDIKTVLTGDPNFKFEAESKKGALEGSGMRDRLQKAKEKSVKPKKVSIDDYI